MFSYLKKLFGNQRSLAARRAARSDSRGRVRPGLEMLEERLVPTWAVSGAGTSHLTFSTLNPTDTFGFTAGNSPQITLNGSPYNGSTSGVNLVTVQGAAGGQNSATIADTTGFNTSLSLAGTYGSLIGANYELDLTGMASIFATGDGNGQARLYGSTALQNNFQATSTWSAMGNSASYDYATGFGHIFGYQGTSTDIANLYGSTESSNHFVASAQAGLVGLPNGQPTVLESIMTNMDPWINAQHPYYNAAVGFQHVTGHAATGSDIADFRGSLTSSIDFVSAPGSSDMSSGTAFDMQGYGFRWVGCVAGTNGDVARLYGSTTFQNSYLGGKVDALGRDDDYLTSSVHSDEVVGFNVVRAYADTSSDVANLYGSTVNDNHFVASAQAGLVGTSRLEAIMFWQNGNPNPLSPHYDGVHGFQQVYGHAARPNDIADFRGSLTTPNTFVSSPALSEMYSGTAFDMQATGFRWVGAVAGTSSDTAVLTGSTGFQNTLKNEVDALGRTDTYLTSSVHSDEVVGFRWVYAYAGTTSDIANISGTGNALSPTDRYVWGTTWAGDNYWIDAHGFN
jgi:hypothetical protein